MTTLTYAAPNVETPCRRRPWLGALAGATSIISTAAINYMSLELAASLAPATCGTGRAQAFQTLIFGMPFALGVPLAAWGVARVANDGVLFCRCGLWASVTGWLTCSLFVMLT